MMDENEPYNKARMAFNDIESRAAVFNADDEAVQYWLSDLQLRLCQWQNRLFGACPSSQQALGVSEELGEMAESVLDLFVGLTGTVGRISHAILKGEQKIRGMQDPDAARRAVADAVADASVFLVQLSTAFRLDYGELLLATAEKVMLRTKKKLEDGNTE